MTHTSQLQYLTKKRYVNNFLFYFFSSVFGHQNLDLNPDTDCIRIRIHLKCWIWIQCIRIQCIRIQCIRIHSSAVLMKDTTVPTVVKY
jgi:hypothetical protein